MDICFLDYCLSQYGDLSEIKNPNPDTLIINREVNLDSIGN